MTTIANLLTSGANVSVTVSVAELREFFRECLNEVQAEREKYISDHAKDSEMLSIQETMEKLQCSKPTLWRWQKSRYLVPVKVGRKLFYRASDVSKLIEGGGTL